MKVTLFDVLQEGATSGVTDGQVITSQQQVLRLGRALLGASSLRMTIPDRRIVAGKRGPSTALPSVAPLRMTRRRDFAPTLSQKRRKDGAPEGTAPHITKEGIYGPPPF
jgi:hypothetical protein